MIIPIKYKEGFKYQLVEPHKFNLGMQAEPPPKGSDYWNCSEFIKLYPNGDVVIENKYAWDGCSGPTKDDSTNMTPGLEHDATYQLIRNKILPHDPFRKIADKRLRDGCRKRGMNWFRAQYYYAGVRLFGKNAATNKRKIYKAK